MRNVSYSRQGGEEGANGKKGEGAHPASRTIGRYAPSQAHLLRRRRGDRGEGGGRDRRRNRKEVGRTPPGTCAGMSYGTPSLHELEGEEIQKLQRVAMQVGKKNFLVSRKERNQGMKKIQV